MTQPTNTNLEKKAATGATPEQQQKPAGLKDNIIYVGKKPAMVYVLAVITQFNNGAKTVTVKARGKMISKAVDVAQIVMHKFTKDVKPSDIKIMTEELASEDGSTSRVSAIEIHLTK